MASAKRLLMRNARGLAAIGAVGVVAAMWLAPVLTAGQAAGQAAAGAAKKSGSTPRTPWGDPDLQGTWSNWDETPFQGTETNPDPKMAKAAAALRAERYGPDGRADGIAGGMADIHFGPVSPRTPGTVVVVPPTR